MRITVLLAAAILATACEPPPDESSLAALTVRPEDAGDYHRNDWGDWATHPGSCTTRSIVLQRQGTDVVTTAQNCRVTGGRWVSPYDKAVLTDPRKLDIDHRVPLAEAARSGARTWTREQRERFYNDLDNLVAVSAKTNRAKGDDDPGEWRPSNRDEWCRYAVDYISIKARYRLTVDQHEHDGLAELLATCP